MFGLIAALIWGGYIAVSHSGVRSGLAPTDLAFLRFGTAGLILLPWLLRNQPGTLAGIGWKRGMALALLAGPVFVLVGASGFLYAPLAHGAVLQLGSVAVVGTLLSALLASEEIRNRQLTGCALVVLGLVIVAGPGLLGGGTTTTVGDSFFVAAGSMWALFTALQRRWNVRPLAVTAVVSVLSALVYIPIYLIWIGTGRLQAAHWMVLAEQAVVLGALSGVIALFAFGRAVETLGGSRAAIFPALAPAIAILLGIPVSGTYPTTYQLVGLVVLSAGMVLGIRKSSTTSED